MTDIERESMEYDVVIVGAGPAGLSAAIRLKQLDPDLSVVVLEKGAEVGAHILSGRRARPRRPRRAPPRLAQQRRADPARVTEDRFYLLGPAGHVRFPNWPMPPLMSNHGNYIVSMGDVCRWLAAAGRGARRRDLPRHGRERARHRRGRRRPRRHRRRVRPRQGPQARPRATSPAWSCTANTCFLAEGVRGSLAKQAIARFGLADGREPQKYGLGMKEIWEVDPARTGSGQVTHTMGWPLGNERRRRLFIYHLEDNQVFLGFVVHLNYKNPWLYPYMEFQRFKHHPLIAEVLKGGKRVAYGARAISEGGWQSIPKLAFPGGALIGCSAGFMNVPRIKGNHNAMLSGIAAAEAAHARHRRRPRRATSSPPTPRRWRPARSPATCKPVRNVKPLWSRYGLTASLALGGPRHVAEHALRQPLALRHPPPRQDRRRGDRPRRALRADRLPEARRRAHLRPADQRRLLLHQPRRGPALRTCCCKDPAHPDRRSTCRATPSRRSATARPGSTRWCATRTARTRASLINFQNCVHCKTCDIKDPPQNINWTTPAGRRRAELPQHVTGAAAFR